VEIDLGTGRVLDSRHWGAKHGMVKLITVEREFGSGGADFAQHLGERLGWRVVDRCLIEEVAAEAGVSAELAEQCDEQLDPWYHRLGKAFWHGGIESLSSSDNDQNTFDAERMVALQRERVLAAAKQGECVIVGRGAASILTTYPGAFHVFVFASPRRKVAWMRERFPEKAEQAEEEIEAGDRRRAAYIRRFYGQDWDDRRLFHLMMDSCMGEAAMLAATLAGAGLKERVKA
jgi:cytidylate kinase